MAEIGTTVPRAPPLSPFRAMATLATSPRAKRAPPGATSISTSKVPVYGSALEPMRVTRPSNSRSGNASNATSATSPTTTRTASRSASDARTIHPWSVAPSTTTGWPPCTSSLAWTRRCSTTPSAGASMRAKRALNWAVCRLERATL